MALEALTWLRRWQSELRADSLSLGSSLDEAAGIAHALPREAGLHTDAEQARLLALLERAGRDLLATPSLIDDDPTRRKLIGLSIGITTIRGMLADRVFTRGFDAINDLDLRAWLRRHGGDPELCVDSAPMAAMYSQLFAFEDGDPARPNIEAGTALRWMMRMSFAYRGSVFYRMQAGMGDVVFAPLYELLAARGVRFDFFHRVEAMLPDADGAVDMVRLTRQAELRDGSYRPLVSVKGLPCWPSAPDFD